MVLFASQVTCIAADPATQPAEPMPHIQVDARRKQVRVECEAVRADYGLEFFACATDTNEYESVLRTAAKPSLIHAALLIIGLVPGEPAKYDRDTNVSTPAHGPLVKLTCEYQSNGKTVNVPAHKLMANASDNKESAPLEWLFCGSKLMEDHTYAADGTGSIVSVLTSELSVITMKDPGHHGLEDRPYKANSEAMPPPDTRVWLVIEPAAAPVSQPAIQPTSQPASK